MKALRTVALGVALVIASATAASAQQQQGAPGRARPNLLLAGIDSAMTADQKAKYDEITKKYLPEMQAVRDLAATDRDAAMKKRADIMVKQNADIRAILTPEQQAIFDKNVEEMAKRMNAPRPAPSI